MMLRGRAATVGITVASGFGWILFGYDLGVLGGVLTLPNFMQHFPMDATMTGLVTGIFELFAMVGALCVALFGARFGRRTNIAVGTGIIGIGAIIQAASVKTSMLFVGRCVGGVGLGIFSSSCPVWQAETMRKDMRGRTVGTSLSFLIVGLILAYWIDYGLAGRDAQVSWRFPFAFQCVLAVINIILTRITPESPRWLLLRGRQSDALEAMCILADVALDDPAVKGELEEIQAAIELEASTKRGLLHLFKADDNVRSRRRMLTACAIQMCQPFSGSTVISFYVTPIFQNSVGLEPHIANLMSGFLQIWFLVASFGTWWLIEHVGRRRMFMTTAAAMSVVMFVLAGLVKVETHASGIVAAALIFLYQSLYTWGWMAGVWMYSTEIQTISYRTFGAALGAATQWLFNYVILQVAPIGIDNIGWRMYFVFAAFNAAFVPFVYLFVPETAGIPLEGLDLCFAPGVNPVKEAARIRAAMKSGNGAATSIVQTHKELEHQAVIQSTNENVEDKVITEHA